MENAKPEPEREYIESGSEPEYFATSFRMESAGAGNIRVYVYSERHHKELHLLFTAVVPAQALAMMGRQALTAAGDAHNIAVWKDEFRH